MWILTRRKLSDGFLYAFARFLISYSTILGIFSYQYSALLVLFGVKLKHRACVVSADTQCEKISSMWSICLFSRFFRLNFFLFFFPWHWPFFSTSNAQNFPSKHQSITAFSFWLVDCKGLSDHAKLENAWRIGTNETFCSTYFVKQSGCKKYNFDSRVILVSSSDTAVTCFRCVF